MSRGHAPARHGCRGGVRASRPPAARSRGLTRAPNETSVTAYDSPQWWSHPSERVGGGTQVKLHEVAFFRWGSSTNDQCVTRRPAGVEFARRVTSATSLSEPEPIN